MTTYTFTPIDTPTANGINDVGQIVGTSGTHGFLDSGGTYTTLNDPSLGTIGTEANGINDAGQIVGIYALSSDVNNHAFLYRNGTYTTLDDGTNGTEANGINNAGQIVGDYFDSNFTEHGFLYKPGRVVTLTTLDVPSSRGTQPCGINDAGQIVGFYFDSSGEHGFLYSGGTYTTLDDPLGTKGTVALGINNLGQIVGSYSDSSGEHGFLYSGGTYTTLDAPLGGKDTFLSGINDAGQIVGSYFDSSVHSSSNEHGFFANPVTIPAVAVEASMYDATGTSAEITSLTTNFLPAQAANATNQGLNPQVYACEALGLVFAFGNETGSTAFSNNFGPSNPSMPATTSGDTLFASLAATAIFGSAETVNTPGAIAGFVSNWKAFYTSNGIPGIPNPTADQADLAARGAAWGDAVGVALANNLGPLPGQVDNFLEDAVQGTAIYSASLGSQPNHIPFTGPATASAASAASNVQLTGVAAHVDHIVM